MLIEKHFSPERLPNGFREGANVLLFGELRAVGPRPDVPLIILSGTGIDPTQTIVATEDQLRQQIEGSSTTPSQPQPTKANTASSTMPHTSPSRSPDQMP